ncbi:MAG: hypothetical protein IPM25_18210 [Chloracidobacterium sp.]|nr:hypothetical protein [Chloracidobacterium sp.]
MKNNLFRIAGALAVLAGIFLAFSCGDTSQNTNNLAGPSTLTSASATPNPFDVKACSFTDLEEKRIEVGKRIRQNIRDNKALLDMLEGRESEGKPPIFSYLLEKTEVPTGSYAPGFLTVTVRGRLNHFDILEGFGVALKWMMARNCIHKVVFLPEQPASPAPGVKTTEGGFEWHYCNYPQLACANGACQDSCDLYLPVTNSNANANVNQNRGANSNSGGNRNSNTNSNSNSVNRPG